MGGSPVTLRALSQTTPSSVPQPKMQLDASLVVNQQSLPLRALVDSGANENFLDTNLVPQAGISLQQLPTLML